MQHRSTLTTKGKFPGQANSSVVHFLAISNCNKNIKKICFVAEIQFVHDGAAEVIMDDDCLSTMTNQLCLQKSR